MAFNIDLLLPEDVVAEHELPETRMTVRSAWTMGDGYGLWLTVDGDQVWPLFDVTSEQFTEWKQAALDADAAEQNKPSSA